MNISTNLKTLRNSRSLTQNQLSKALNITRASLGAYEESRALPNVKVLCKYSDYFNVSIDDLVKKNLEKKEEASNQ
jgi:transcriptional regulator with XRE-family HTH domain